MNKLLEILQEFDSLTLGYCNDDELDETSYLAGQAHFKEYYKKFLKEKLVEYARSTVPGYVPQKWGADANKKTAEIAFNFCREKTFKRIDQDIQSLNN